MKVWHKQIHTDIGQCIEVTYNMACNIMLLDPPNRTNYLSGRCFKYHGGHYNGPSPATLWPPHPGEWYVVVDLGGAPGTLKPRFMYILKTLQMRL